MTSAAAAEEAKRQRAKRDQKLRLKAEKKAAAAAAKQPAAKPAPLLTGFSGMGGLPSFGGAHFLPPPMTAEKEEELAAAKKAKKAAKEDKEAAKKAEKAERPVKPAPVATGLAMGTGMGGGPSFGAAHFLPAPSAAAADAAPKERLTTTPPPSYAAERAQVAAAAFHARSSLEESLEDKFRLAALGVGSPVLAYRFERKPTAAPAAAKKKVPPKQAETEASSVYSDTTLASTKTMSSLKKLFGKR
ncbi:uncharacterized protein PSFLO_01002 [Pseudozyma flocculosa]|uniref:Uncharacterized protein n=1 Tax=Pseudozyma flocculosa TaxID=84751 RepID=A0A5C3EWQ1_9BASI|nr:uncharacterized protein PSFLO_01002 [Pseudozyma flocculosa]